jgi:hypothetical protein
VYPLLQIDVYKGKKGEFYHDICRQKSLQKIEQITEIQNKLRKWEGSCILTVKRYRLLIIAGSFADN